MKNTTTRLFALIIISTMILGACNLPKKQDQADIDATTVAETAAAVFTKAAETAAAVPSSTPLAAETVTPIPTNTLFPTQAATATKTPIPCNRATFGKDVTIPDNTAVQPGQVFTKTWEIKNSGSCPWTSGYVLLFDSGDQMNAPATASFTSGSVSPGGTVSISVELTAPTTPGTYQANFKLRSPDNIVFGINADGQGPFWVKVVVAKPTATATATTVPTADFSISYDNVHSCGTPYATVKVTNTGGFSFKSVEISIKNTTDSTILYGPSTNNTPFLNSATGCPPEGSALASGATAYIAANIGAPPSGKDATYTLKMCTEDDLAGNCIVRSVNFVTP